MKKRFLSLFCVLAFCLGLLPVTALAADEIDLYVGGQQIKESGCYANQNGTWTKVEGTGPSSGQFYYDADSVTLTLNQAEISYDGTVNVAEGYTYEGSVIAFSQTADVSLKIELQGDSTITGTGGIRVESTTGNASLSIKGPGSLDVEPKGSNSGITLCSSKNTNLDIDGADVTASSPAQYGVYLISSTDASSTSTITVNNGSLTTGGNGNVGIYYYWSGTSNAGTSSLTVSGNAVVDTRNSKILTNNEETGVQVGAGGDGNGGIVFNGKNGTVYGDVTLQEDLEIGNDETLTVPDGSKLDCNEKLTNNGTINVEDGGTVSGNLSDGTEVTTPSITAQPTDQTVTKGQSATFTVEASAGSETPTYQWQQKTAASGSDWTDISQETSASYTISSTTTSMSGNQYRCVVKSAGGVSVISQAATLTVETYTPPTTYTIRADVTPAGSGSVSGGGNYTEGTSVTLTATNNPGYRFVGWVGQSGQSVSSDNPFTFVATSDSTLTAKFEQVYTVTVNVSGNGTAIADKNTAAAGETVTLTATPDSGYHFDGWSVVPNTVTIQNNQFTMPAGNVEIQAIFDRNSSGGSTTPSKTPSQQAVDKIESAKEGSTVEITLRTGQTKLDKEVFEELAGRDVTLEISLSNGVTWTVNGQDIPENADLTDLDMGVSLNTSTIPVNLINSVTGEAGTVQLTLKHDGPFGFKATLVAPMGEDVAGMYANLYRYDDDAEALDFEVSGVVDEDGTVRLAIDHASSWLIALDARSHALPFADADEDLWYSEAVRWTWLHGIMTGYADGSGRFGTDDSLTRAQMAAVLYNVAGKPDVDVSGLPGDCDGGAWYASCVSWALGVGVFNGYGDGSSFGPDDPLTREQAACVLMNAASVLGADVSARTDLSAFPDADEVSPWASDALSWAVAEGVLSGVETADGARELQPTRACTRAEMAALMMSLSARSAE
ncbi:S-layer homology domain-containing protein [Collinsella tanakaei]|uniref:InlB B-repeat-containing protein n=1 Tax=Collinsella tanakaei TaxID=626935 RepID=UPI00195CDCA3|nr:S-layer homology domain-containing protein [Collinsella tanakaei]MBM6779151.1 S-layer homology domain-containing protein [Collinsella tanakaei]